MNCTRSEAPGNFPLTGSSPAKRCSASLSFVGSKVPAFSVMLLVLFFVNRSVMPIAALEMTPELLFTQLEERTERVDSLEADVELASGVLSTRLTMSIQNPDRFSMDFVDNRMRIVFDGERLWIYIARMFEVYTLGSGSGGGAMSDSLREWVNPRKIITNLTKKTLFTVFDIELLSTENAIGTSSATPPLSPEPASLSWRLRFTPLGEGIITKLFDIGSYEMTFSAEHFLPTRVVEFSPDGIPRGTLTVHSYRLNQPFPKGRFTFEIPEGVKEVPISEVLAQKFEGSKDLLMEGVGSFFRRIKERISNWGI
ncbi:MAG: hypothetical protein WA705_13235 [Candidatus Ozemobacteraceae bacterium]